MNDSNRIVYRALPTLADFHASDAFYRGVMGPVGSGKSTAMCMELMRRAFSQPPGPDNVGRTRFAILRNSYRELSDTTLKTWLDWFPEHLFGVFEKTGMRHLVRLDGPRGPVACEVLFRSLDRPGDVKKLLSLELTGAWINEAREMPKAVVDAVGDRVERFPPARDGGCAWAGVIMDTNPPDADHWWHRLAEEERPEGWAFFRQPGGLAETASGRFEPNPGAENLENLPPDYYARRMAGKSPSHVRVYYCSLYGLVQDGRPVYPEFVDRVHVAAGPIEPVEGRTLHVGLDFGLTPAAVMGQRLVSGRWVWLDELVACDMGMTRFAEVLLARLNERYRDLEWRITGDPAGMQRSQVDERTPFDVLRARGLDARPAPSNDFLLRREAVALPLTRLVDGEPGLVVSPACRTLVQGMAGGYRYRRVEMPGEERFHDVPDKNRFSHVCEAGQYLMLGAGEGVRVIRPESGQGRQRPGRTENDYDPFNARGML